MGDAPRATWHSAAAEVRWLFFDLGNTLISEEAATEARLRQVAGCFRRHGRRCSVEDVRSALREASAEFASRLITAAIAKLTDVAELRRAIEADTRYPKELEALYEGAEQILRTLSSRYRIGVIANQSPGTEGRLTKWGLMPLVSLCLASAELGLEKPDPAIFHLALSRAECAPVEAVMIGDRLDNDIRPARLQGWRTVRILQGFARFQSPRDEFDEADASVKQLDELLPLFLPAIV
jgi:HAD superfamily hydrolase (TIGR01549 family)